MSKKVVIALALASCIIVNMPHSAQAFTGIMDDWQGYYNPCQTLVDFDCNACHQNGFDFNSYGEDLRVRIEDLSMSNIDAFVDAELEDSDGDGYTNGQEIVIDCTLPWDNSSQGVVADEGATWDQIKALYR